MITLLFDCSSWRPCYEMPPERILPSKCIKTVINHRYTYNDCVVRTQTKRIEQLLSFRNIIDLYINIQVVLRFIMNTYWKSIHAAVLCNQRYSQYAAFDKLPIFTNEMRRQLGKNNCTIIIMSCEQHPINNQKQVNHIDRAKPIQKLFLRQSVLYFLPRDVKTLCYF